MIKDISISYKHGYQSVIRTVEVGDDISYRLAEVFESIIRDSEANDAIIVECLKNAFSLE